MNTTTNIRNLLYSTSIINDVEVKDKVLEILDDCKYLDKIEKEILKAYKLLCNEVNGVPTNNTLIIKDQEYTNCYAIPQEALIDFTKIFTNSKQNIEMHTLIHEGLNKYLAGDIDYGKFGDMIQKALVVGSPSKMEDNIESNLDDNFYEKLTEEDNTERGVEFGIPCIDDLYRGILPGDIITIAGYTGSMKTTLSANLAYNAITKGKNVLYLSLEVSKEDLTFGLLSRHSLVSGEESITRKDIKEFANKHKEKFKKLVDSYTELEGKIRIIDEKDITTYSTTAFNDVIEKVNEELVEKTGKKIDIIILDHIQLLKFNDSKSAMDNPYLLINYYTSYFREKAAREGYAVILVSQTSRTGYEYAVKHNGQYLETGLAEANELERASTCIVTVFTTEGGKGSNEITVQLLKNRFGEKMDKPSQATLLAPYFMVGNGVSLETEKAGAVFNNTDISDLFKKQGDISNINFDDLLNGI